MSSTSGSRASNSTRFVRVCVYEAHNFGGQYVEQAVEAKTPGVSSLPHAQNFSWGESYLPDNGTVCAIPTEAPTPVPTATATATATLQIVATAMPTSTATPWPTVTPSATAVPTKVPTEVVTPTPLPTEIPTPTDVPMPPPAQLPLTDYAK